MERWVDRQRQLKPVGSQQDSQLKSGLSVVIPVNRIDDHLTSAVESFQRQTISNTAFELIIVLNGDAAERATTGLDFNWVNGLNLVVVATSLENAGGARNVGLEFVSREFITFVDADDLVGPQFVEEALKSAGKRRCVQMPLYEFEDSGGIKEWRHGARQRRLGGFAVPIAVAPWVLGYNGGKILKTETAKQIRFPVLRSGEDVVYFANLLKNPWGLVEFAKAETEWGYLRRITPTSVSRGRENTYEFAIEERREVIRLLESLVLPIASWPARRRLVRSQTSFISRFLRDHPLVIGNKINDSITEGEERQGPPRVLAFLFCFPPYSDPSGIVAAKRLARFGLPVDVVQGDLGKVRPIDPTLSRDRVKVVKRSFTIPKPVSFGDPRIIFLNAAIGAIYGLSSSVWGRSYSTVYSRSNWPTSHASALIFKLVRPSCYWVAEFSDPLCLDVKGNRREGRAIPRFVIELISRAVGLSFPDSTNVNSFELIELLTLTISDTVVFTNEIQKSVTLTQYPEAVREQVMRKSLVLAQPEPPEDWFGSARTPQHSMARSIKIGYFGSVAFRGDIRSIVELISNEFDNGCLQLQIFTTSKEAQSLQSSSEEVQLREPLPYFQFLEALKEFDILLIADSVTDGSLYETNPYLPSKLADYQGSGSAIWAISEVGSPLDMIEVSYKSTSGNLDEHRNVLHQIVTDFEGTVARRC